MTLKTIKYISRTPKKNKLPAGQFYAHNRVAFPAQDVGEGEEPIGVNGWRVWVAQSSDDADAYAVKVCDCQWAAHLGEHFTPADRK